MNVTFEGPVLTEESAGYVEFKRDLEFLQTREASQGEKHPGKKVRG